MQIQIIAIGKIREAYLKEGIEVYRIRLSRWHTILITDLVEERIAEKCSATEKQSAKEEEGKRLIAAAPDKTVGVALDPGGEMLSSNESFSKDGTMGTERTGEHLIFHWRTAGPLPCSNQTCRPCVIAFPDDISPPAGPAHPYRADLPC